jgi:hypothetical protein
MATKQRGPQPPVLSSEQTRVKPPEEDEEELPPEEPSWDPQRDSTQLLPNSTPRPTWDGVDEATPPVPRKVDPAAYAEYLSGMQEPFDATRPIPRKGAGNPPLQTADDATRPIPRKTGARPALKEQDDSTRQIPRKPPVDLPELQEPDDSTRQIPRKSGPRPGLPKAEPAVELPPAWDPGEDASVVPTRAQGLPPIISGPHQSMVYPPEGPPVLVPQNTQPHFIPQAPSVPLVTQPNYLPPPPPAAAPMLTSPNYVPAPPAVLHPVVTAPHLVPSAPPVPQGEEPPLELRTTFSNKAAMVADLVKATFSRRSYGIAPYRLRIDEPDGPSTAGGLHARQPISLVSNLESAPAVVCGWVDVAKKEAQLRSYGVVVKRHKGRYTDKLDITEEEYDRFLNELVETLFYGGIKIVVQVPDDEPVQTPAAQAQAQAQAQAKRGGASCLGTLVLLTVTFVLGLALGMMNAERLAPLVEKAMSLLPGH